MRNRKSGYGNDIYKELVISNVRSTIDAWSKDYKEPERAGTPRGDAIGFSKKKVVAAAWLVLHPSLEIREIAKLAGVTPGVLSVWRTQDKFKTVELDFSRKIGEGIAKAIVGASIEEFIEDKESGPGQGIYTVIGDKIFALKSKREAFEHSSPKSGEEKEVIIIDDSPDRWTAKYNNLTDKDMDSLLVVLSWLNVNVFEEFITFYKRYIDYPYVGFHMVFFRRILFFWDEDNPLKRKAWLKQPWMVEITKSHIESTIDMLVDPKFHEYAGPERVKKLAEEFKQAMIEDMEILCRI